jgi:hypothetical protein
MITQESSYAAYLDGTSLANNKTRTGVELLCFGELGSTMQRLLDACPRLTSFELGRPYGTLYSGRAKNPPRVASHDDEIEGLVSPRAAVSMLLEMHCHTLERICLSFYPNYCLKHIRIHDNWAQTGARPEDSIYTYPSLRDFGNLTGLNTEFDSILSLRHLPESLKHLTLSFCHFGDVDDAYLRDLYGLKDTWCLAIQSVVLSSCEKAAPVQCVDISEGWNGVMSLSGALALNCSKSTDERCYFSSDGCILNLFGAGYDLLMKSERPESPDLEDDEESD